MYFVRLTQISSKVLTLLEHHLYMELNYDLYHVTRRHKRQMNHRILNLVFLKKHEKFHKNRKVSPIQINFW